MNPFYLECCKDLNWTLDQNLANKMKATNEEKIKVKPIRIYFKLEKKHLYAMVN